MNKTLIEWVRNPDGTPGYTWNPLTGCLNHTNGLCKGGGFPCYAYKLANGRLRSRYLANDNLAVKLTDPRVNPAKSLKSALDIKEAAKDPFYPRFWEDRLEQPKFLGGGMFGLAAIPKGIFTVDMGELFGDWIPREWQDEIFDVIDACPQHRFYLLTKQPQNLIKWSPFPPNCYVGVTATNPTMFAEACYRLGRIIAMVKYISLEPLLDFQPDPAVLTRGRWIYDWLLIGDIKQVIIGAQTKPTVYPKIEWVELIVKACLSAGIPVFLKDNLEAILPKQEPFYKARKWHAGGGWELRQEVPG